MNRDYEIAVLGGEVEATAIVKMFNRKRRYCSWFMRNADAYRTY